MTNIPFRFRQIRVLDSLILVLFSALACWPVLAKSDQFQLPGRLGTPADQQPAVEVANPRGTNPLAPSETKRVKQVADSASQVLHAKSRAAGLRRPRALGQLAPVQALYVQRHSESKNAHPQSRKADVFYYDYANNQVIQVVTDTTTNSVQETHVSSGINNQPFFTSTEINAAIQLIYDHPELGSRLRKVYQDITGQSLDNINQLVAQGGVYTPDSTATTGLDSVAANCLEDRCMQLFISVDDRRFIDVSNLTVDLSKGEILWVEEGLTGHSH